MQQGPQARDRRLAILLSGLFGLAMIMGPGPGLHLVNPRPEAAQSATVFGLPVLYAWGIGWFSVQAGVLCVAAIRLWSRAED